MSEASAVHFFEKATRGQKPCPDHQEAIVEGGGGLGGRGGIHGLPCRQTECRKMICNYTQRSSHATPLAHRMSLKLLLSAAPLATVQVASATTHTSLSKSQQSLLRLVLKTPSTSTCLYRACVGTACTYLCTHVSVLVSNHGSDTYA